MTHPVTDDIIPSQVDDVTLFLLFFLEKDVSVSPPDLT